MKLEVGMYCRYIAEFLSEDINKKIVKIGKIIKIKDNYIELDSFNNRGMSPIEYFTPAIIGKPSHNIIDLIEIGDYVNGFSVEDYFHKYNEEKDILENIGVVTTECYLEDVNFNWILEKDIKTILTHEQFENNCFRIGDN